MISEKDKRWIKNWKPKGVKMRPTKKKPAKRNDNPIIGKLLKLKYRINDTASEEGGWSADLQESKAWVMKLISEVRLHNFTKLAKEDVLKCNSLWRLYEG